MIALDTAGDDGAPTDRNRGVRDFVPLQNKILLMIRASPTSISTLETLKARFRSFGTRELKKFSKSSFRIQSLRRCRTALSRMLSPSRYAVAISCIGNLLM